MKKVFALAGNQNSGKTTLFNQLTGSNQHVGNFPGVTVEKKEGMLKNRKNCTVVDLPGIYSLSPYTAEEIVTRDFLIKEKPSGIINIVDATNIERNLYLTLQLIELGLPMIIALNMMDEIRSSNTVIKVQELEKKLGIPVVPISAAKNEGISELIERLDFSEKPSKYDFCSGPTHKAIHAIAHIIEDNAKNADIPTRFAATKVVENDSIIINKLHLKSDEEHIISEIIDDMEKALETDRIAALADMRYTYIEEICKDTVIKNGISKEKARSIKIDSVLTNKYLAIPIFICVMLSIFWLTFGVIGSFLSDILSAGIDYLTKITSIALDSLKVNQTIHSLVIDGIFSGIGSVLSFMPLIITLFFFLSILEDSGYMARVAFVMDKLLRKIGLSGKCFVPMLIGFGCSVPAVMATRTLPSSRDRKMTILMIPFMSCSAKIPIYTLFTSLFFKDHQAIVMISLYLLGMILSVLSALVFKSTIFKGSSSPFVLELPAYRFPSLKSVTIHMWEKTKDFIQKAFTIIFVATIIIWFLQSFDFRFNLVEASSNSMLAIIGRKIAFLFKPLGFGNWQSVAALITGLTAKEAVVSTLSILTGAGTGTEISNMVAALFTKSSALSFLVFTLLYMPCVATMAAIKRELGGYRKAALVMLYQTAFAWVVSFIVYRIAVIFI